MDIWTLLRITARRWYASVPILLIGLGLSLYLFENVEPVYTAESTAILTPPTIYEGNEEGEIIEVNPFLDLGGSLNTTTEVMVVLMDSNAKRFAYEERGLEPEYVVDRNDAVMYFEVVGPDADSVVSTATELTRIADEEMAALQGATDAPTEERVTVVPLSLPENAEEDALVGLRFIAVVAALAIGLAVSAGLLVDVAARRRDRRQPDGIDDGGQHGADDEGPGRGVQDVETTKDTDQATSGTAAGRADDGAEDEPGEAAPAHVRSSHPRHYPDVVLPSPADGADQPEEHDPWDATRAVREHA